MYLKADKIENQRYALCDLAILFYNDKEYDKALAITDSLTTIVENEQPLDSALMGYILDAAVPSLYMKGRYEEIDKAFDSFLKDFYNSKEDLHNTLIRSYIEHENGNYYQAESIINHAFGLAENDREIAQVIYAAYKESLASENYQQAAILADSLIYFQGALSIDLVNESVSIIQRDFYTEKAEREKEKSCFLTILLVTSIIVAIIIALFIWRIYCLKLKANRAELESQISSFLLLKKKVSNIESENSALNRALNNKNTDHNSIVENLFKEKWSTLNMLCNEYFDQSDSDSTRRLILSKIEKELRQLRSPKKLNEIVESVDKYFNGIISLLREECGSINEDDITFLALIIAGFSVRAVCYFTDIKYKNYYLKKSRLCKRIELSDAKHKELFLTKIKG